MNKKKKVSKTKRTLRIELAKLLQEKALNQITITELVEKADIHRTTFYNNYENIDLLYQDLEDIIIHEINNFSLLITNRATMIKNYNPNQNFFELLFSLID